MRKYLFVFSGLALAIGIAIVVHSMLSPKLEAPKITPKAEILKNMSIIVGQAYNYVENKKLKTLDNQFKAQFLADREATKLFSFVSLNVNGEKISDDKGTTYDLQIIPPDSLQVVASDGQTFSLKVLQ